MGELIRYGKQNVALVLRALARKVEDSRENTIQACVDFRRIDDIRIFDVIHEGNSRYVIVVDLLNKVKRG